MIILRFLGNLVVKVAIGRKIASNFNKEYGIAMELLIGTVVYIILDITAVGRVFTFIAKFFGMGEVIQSIFAKKQQVY